ncbi:hypothetical protein J6590_103832, partial [Homalodisca vitripennis]
RLERDYECFQVVVIKHACYVDFRKLPRLMFLSLQSTSHVFHIVKVVQLNFCWIAVNDLLFPRKLINSNIDDSNLLCKLDLRTSRHLRQTHLFARLQYSSIQYLYHSTFPRLQLLAYNMLDEIDIFSRVSTPSKRHCWTGKRFIDLFSVFVSLLLSTF